MHHQALIDKLRSDLFLANHRADTEARRAAKLEALLEQAEAARDAAQRALLLLYMTANRDGWERGPSEAEARDVASATLFNHRIDPGLQQCRARILELLAGFDVSEMLP